MALVKVAEKAALKARRSVFRQLIKDLEKAGEESAIGYQSGGFGNYRFNPGSAVLLDPVRKSSMGTGQLDPLREVISTRMADPESIALEALRTGRLGGRKLSSNQRRQVGQAAKLADAEREAVENLKISAYSTKPYAGFSDESNRYGTGASGEGRRRRDRVEKKLDNLIGKYSNIRQASPQTRRSVSAYSEGEKIVEQLDKVIKAAKNLPEPRRSQTIQEARNAQALARMKDEMGGFYEQVYDPIPKPLGGTFARVREMRESTGLPAVTTPWGYNDAPKFDNLRTALQSLEGNPRAQETVLSMWKEWEGTAEELANMARILSE